MHSCHRWTAYLFCRNSPFVHIDLLTPNGLYCRVWETWSFAMNSCLWRIRLISCQRYSLLDTRWLTLIQGVIRWKISITSMSSHDVRVSMYHATSRYVMYPIYLHIEISLIFWSKRQYCRWVSYSHRFKILISIQLPIIWSGARCYHSVTSK